MKGLYGYNQLKKDWPISTPDFSFGVDTNQKFESDKIFKETERFIIGLDGVVLNKSQLVKSDEEWLNFFLNNLNRLAEQLNKLRGVFHGFIYDKVQKELILFNDPTGNKNFFIYHKDGHLMFHHSDVKMIKFLKEHNLKPRIQEKSIYAFLAYRFLPNEWSWIQGSKRLKPGTILKFKDQEITQSRYKVFVSNPHSQLKTQEILYKFEYLFKNAVQLQYNKDVENKYKHYATLSGGLDSRSTILMGYALGFKNQTTFTCSRIGYADEIIAEQIAKEHQFNHIFYALDSIQHLFNLPETIEKIGATALYSGPAHVIRGIDENWSNAYGIIHTGHIGDGVMGAFLSKTKQNMPNLSFGRVNPNLLPHQVALDKEIIAGYSSEEEYKLYERAFGGAAAGVWGLEYLSYNISPFIDVDVLDFLLSLPYKNKFRRKIYVEWLLKYHPNWTVYELESLRAKPNKYWKFRYQTTYLRLRFGWRKLLSRNYRLRNTMTPEQYWFENNQSLQNYYSTEYEKAIQLAQEHHLSYINSIEKFYHCGIYAHRAKSLHIAYVINLIYGD
ncbi:hypothetical protein GO491_02240 [Flavobacteriaceae bacterium Ap0902]|nr:hypothetical protein [Flavobacteriaceae bacterium Ap0902]